MPDTKKLSASEMQAAIRKLEMRLRNAANNPTSQASHAWPDQYSEIARHLAGVIPADAPDEVFNGAMNDLADQPTQLFRAWTQGRKDVKQMTTLELHEEGNRLAALAAAAKKTND